MRVPSSWALGRYQPELGGKDSDDSAGSRNHRHDTREPVTPKPLHSLFDTRIHSGGLLAVSLLPLDPLASTSKPKKE